MTPRRRLIVANWKMNGRLASGLALAREVADKAEAALPSPFDVVVCPPATLVWAVGAAVMGKPIIVGAQDCHVAAQGAYTGDLSAEMFKDLGARAVILGHSERRQGHGETNALIAQKVEAAQAAGLLAIVCIGETAAELDAGQTEKVLTQQVRESVLQNVNIEQLVIAYEPVWAIGTGRLPSPEDVVKVHKLIRSVLGAAGAKVRILYGGSVNPANVASFAAEAEIDGVLVGGASLKADSFWAIAEKFQ